MVRNSKISKLLRLSYCIGCATGFITNLFVKCYVPDWSSLFDFLLVYLFRCVAKYWEIHERVGKKLQKMSTQDEEALKKLAAEQGLIK